MPFQQSQEWVTSSKASYLLDITRSAEEGQHDNPTLQEISLKNDARFISHALSGAR